MLKIEKLEKRAPVYDITVEKNENFYANGILVHNCGEVSLTVTGGYCVIADNVPFHAETLAEVFEAAKVTTRSLIRTNLMDCLYSHETKRTNRIGVGLTGVHEFAWKFFEVGFRHLINPDVETASVLGPKIARFHMSPSVRAGAFWLTLAELSNAIVEEGIEYSKELGVNVPHTMLTVKPSGSVSKLFGLTEGWHLPAMEQYLRWVQFRTDDLLVNNYKNAGYRWRELKTYSGTTIIGFPTQPVIGSLNMGEHLVTAHEATPEEQYKWLQLGEKYWIKGGNESGNDYGNQISYTLKYDPKIVDFQHFLDMLIKYQSVIRCCSVLPIADTSAYEYTPEEAVSKAEYEKLVHEIQAMNVREDIGREHLDCGTGGCPIDFNEDKKGE